jgi:cytochrome c551/c552
MVYRVHCHTCNKDIGGPAFNKKMAAAFKERHEQDCSSHQVKIYKEGLPRLGRW